MNKKRKTMVIILAGPEERKDKLALLKKAIAEGTYRVRGRDIAEKIIQARLFELALTLYDRKHRKCRDN